MVKFVDGDFFDYDTDIRVNTVNCVGVMGAGVALAFKNKYPKMYKEYVNKCKKKEVKPGEPYAWSEGDLYTKKITIINFPTKDHWRKKSEYEYVESGLKWLKSYLSTKKNESITLPALGCGHGGLDWQRVKKMIEDYLSDSPVEIFVFTPNASKSVKKNILIDPEKKLELEKSNIDTISSDDVKYPEYLKRFSEKTLYAKGNLSILEKKSICLICSTKPNDIEEKIIYDFFQYTQDKNLNIILGGSAFDKKNMKSMDEYTFTCILPSGIKIFCDKKINQSVCDKEKILLLSSGNPFVEFDKAEFINSVLTKIYLSTVVLFTTPSLDWLKKQNKRLSSYNGKLFYVNYDEVSEDTKSTLKNMHIEEAEKDDTNKIVFSGMI